MIDIDFGRIGTTIVCINDTRNGCIVYWHQEKQKSYVSGEWKWYKKLI